MSVSYQSTHHTIPEHLNLWHNHYENLNFDKERTVCVCVCARARMCMCWNSPSTKYSTKRFAIATDSEKPTLDTNIMNYDLLAHNNDGSVVGIFYKVTECIWGGHSLTLHIWDVKLSTYCLIHMTTSNKTLVQDIQSSVTFLATVQAASLSFIHLLQRLSSFKMALITWKHFSAVL